VLSRTIHRGRRQGSDSRLFSALGRITECRELQPSAWSVVTTASWVESRHARRSLVHVRSVQNSLMIEVSDRLPEQEILQQCWPADHS
jgi:hypothetical protein